MLTASLVNGALDAKDWIGVVQHDERVSGAWRGATCHPLMQFLRRSSPFVGGTHMNSYATDIWWLFNRLAALHSSCCTGGMGQTVQAFQSWMQCVWIVC